MIRHIPNAITCLNLFSGCVGIAAAFGGDLYMASWAIVIAALLDFADGFTARLLKAYSEIGKELDSLADVVSFGVLPSVILFHLAGGGINASLLPYATFAVAIFSAIRLAKFNVDTRQSEKFIGLPTPANALLIASFPFIAGTYPQLTGNPVALAVIGLILGLLLVSNIPLLSMKMKSTALAPNVYRYLLVFSALILLLIFKFAAVPVIFILYFLLSFIHFRTTK